MFGRKKKGIKKSPRPVAVPYKKCGHKRKAKLNGMVVTVHCSKNGNVLHKHD